MSNENDQASSITQDLPKILSGELPEYIVTHPGHSQYSNAGGGVSACGVAALNSARLVLGLHAAGIDSAQLVQELTERSFLEVRIQIQSCLPVLIYHMTILLSGYPQALLVVVDLVPSGGR